MAPTLLILSNGEGCFSLKLKIRAAVSREYAPPSLASLKGTLNTRPGSHTAHACVFSHSVSDFECFCKVVNLYFFYQEIPKQANTWLPQSFLSQWRKLAGDLSCVGVSSLLFWNVLQDGTKTDIWCPGGGSGLLCRPEDRLWGTSAVWERTWDELARYCNVFIVTCAPAAVGVGGMQDLPLGNVWCCRTSQWDVVAMWPAYKPAGEAEQLQRSHHNSAVPCSARLESQLYLLSLIFSRAGIH